MLTPNEPGDKLYSWKWHLKTCDFSLDRFSSKRFLLVYKMPSVWIKNNIWLKTVLFKFWWNDYNIFLKLNFHFSLLFLIWMFYLPYLVLSTIRYHVLVLWLKCCSNFCTYACWWLKSTTADELLIAKYSLHWTLPSVFYKNIWNVCFVFKFNFIVKNVHLLESVYWKNQWNYNSSTGSWFILSVITFVFFAFWTNVACE